mgnify:FL=1|jgi:predicted site-specific integrase-resolvase
MESNYITGKKALKILGVCKSTLYKYDREGKIDTIRTPGNKRLYNVNKYLKSNGLLEDKQRKKICYCRVSGAGKKMELENQKKYMMEKYPTHELLWDIGSGINFKRSNFNKILDYGINNELDELVICYKDRLCRIGYVLVENILHKYSNTKIIILNDDNKGPEQEVVDDMLQIITVFGSKVYGMRRYKKNDDNKK